MGYPRQQKNHLKKLRQGLNKSTYLAIRWAMHSGIYIIKQIRWR